MCFTMQLHRFNATHPIGVIQEIVIETVATEEGQKAIEDIEVGDLVWVTDTETGYYYL